MAAIRTRRGIIQLVGTLALLALVVLTLRERLPAPADVGRALASADHRWLLAAGIAEFVSMAMFARQQRRLLTAFGVTMPRHRALALSYSRSAIAISLPAGSVVSAAYAFREFRAGGADRAAATAVMVLSGVLSLFGLALLYATGALTTALVHLSAAWNTHPAPTLAAAVVLVGLTATALHRLTAVRRRNRDVPAEAASVRPPRMWPWLAALVRPAVEAVTSSRGVAPRHWLLALAAATGNWLTDLACLFAATRAFGIEIGLLELATVYLTVQIVRQIPLTPGGIGVIEISLLAGLAAAGAAESPAAAAVLTYRLLSCWLIIPAGLLAWLVLRRAGRSGRSPGSDLVDRALPDEFGPGEHRPGLGEHGAVIGPGGHVGEQQPARAGPDGELPRLLARQVHAGRTVG
ncbi:hypothetical protein SAMN05216266_105192 [Amycolatopsis marina]|uniref:Lysylphosphatidylglycerol synthase TM region n=1 Tax=Amycolatopsis marina TaxID=490629 RepID=A0A1I0YLL6_9PSEU|nr:hypothetical protein SAMN05216266_105192 [Amycolatopsis marina]